MVERAVVLGASMAGLMATKVLSEAYDDVVVVERDTLPAGPGDRRGVPQGRHAHTLLPSGARCLEALFPGLLCQLVRDGATVLQDLPGLYFEAGGHGLCQTRGTLRMPAYEVHRSYLEGMVRARVRDVPNVRILDGTDVTNLLPGSGRARASGVRVAARDDGERELGSDLVVDALGRATRTPAWLDSLGYARAPEEQVPIDVSYVSEHLDLPPAAIRETLVLVGATPGRPKGMALLACEDGSWIWSVFGYRGHHPPRDHPGLLAFVGDVAPPHVLRALCAAEPITSTATYRITASRRRHYERLRRFPEGLVVIGDAICSLNPVYGQGMSVAALEALALRDSLATSPQRLATTFFAAAAASIDRAWQLSTGPDLALPDVDVPTPPSVRLVNAYVDQVLTAAGPDPELSDQLLMVIALVDPPSRLFSPSVIGRVATARLRHRTLS